MPWAHLPVDSPWFDVDGDKVRLLRDGVEAFPAMLEAIAAAHTEVILEMYWVGADAVGATFRDALIACARRGITVRVIYDAIGSIGIAPTFWDPLRIAGGEVREYHPLWPLRPTFALRDIEQRDHRKLLVVDSAVGFTGGLNLARQWLPLDAGGHAWRDDMIEIRGHAATELRTLFYKTWRRIWFRRLPQEVGPMNVPRDLVPLSRRPTRRVYVLASLRRSRRSLRREYLMRINGAKRSIEIANSYFLPDRQVRNALFRAVLRGVRVRVLIPAKSDVPVVQYALEAMYEALLRGGIELFCHPAPMMHAKTAIIDDEFATIGSYNLDERSRRKNLDVNIGVRDQAFATHVRQWFDRDVAKATRVDIYEWRARPLARRPFEYLAYALRKLW